jgi:hypothetical protein
MKRLAAASLCVVLWCPAAAGEQVVEKISWRDLDEAGELLNGEFLGAETPDDRDALRVENQAGGAKTVTVLILDRPKISTVGHAIEGEVAYKNMAPGSCLEMWTTFEQGEMVFSRTLGLAGPLEGLNGTSGWRGFMLPLFSVEELSPPRRIELNVVFTGGGSASLGPVRLVEYSKGESPLPGAEPPKGQPLVQPKQVGEISWAKLEAAGELLAGKVDRGEPPDPVEQLTVEHSKQERKAVTVAVVEKPNIDGFQYQVAGWVKHEDVASGSCLEMWNTFADGRRAFTRTLAPSGPMRNLDGSSDWRPFLLPFQSDETAGLPKKLEINVVFAGPGTVHLSPLRIEQHAAAPRRAAAARPVSALGGRPGAWWDERTAGLIGGIGGTVLGLLGGLMGTLGGFGKARRFVTALAILMTLSGVAAFLVGLVALGIGQPYAVYYPLLLGGGIAAVVCGGLLPVIRRRYDEIELRKMTAMDFEAAGRRAADQRSTPMRQGSA